MEHFYRCRKFRWAAVNEEAEGALGIRWKDLAFTCQQARHFRGAIAGVPGDAEERPKK